MNILIICSLSLLLSLAITTFITPKILFISVKKKMLDVPNSRKIHKQTSSRLGGVAFFPGLFLTICAVIPSLQFVGIDPADMHTSWLMLSLGAGFLMYFVGVADDINGVSYRTKFFYQILTSILIIVSGAWINNLYGIFGIYEIDPWIGVPLTSLFIVFIMNAINLIDGIDGLSSGLSIVALSFYGAIFVMHAQLTPAIIAFTTIGVLLGFFRYNFFGFPNRSVKIFMGDTGTLFIGAIISILALRLVHFDGVVDTGYEAKKEILTAYSVLIVPCFDVVRVMLHRLKNGKHLFCADSNHIHHKILSLGFTTKQTLFIILSFSALITIVNLLLNRWIRLEYIILFDVIIWTLCNIMLTQKRTRK